MKTKLTMMTMIEAGHPADRAAIARALARMASSIALDAPDQTLLGRIMPDVIRAEAGTADVAEQSGPEFREHFADLAWDAAVRAVRAVGVEV